MYKTIFMVFEGDVMHDATVSPSRKHAHTILDVNSSILGQQKRFTAVNFDFLIVFTRQSLGAVHAPQKSRERYSMRRVSFVYFSTA